MWIILAVFAAYLLGAIPFSLILGKRVKGIDLREHGSGNLGASNVYRNLGPWWGGLCLLLDMAKGAGAVLLVTLAIDAVPAGQALPLRLSPDVLRIVAGVLAILGHSFSPFVNFQGGKGIATSFGAFLVLEPFPSLIAFGIFLAVFFATRIVSLGSLCAMVVFPWAVLFFEYHADHRTSVTLIVFAFVLSGLAIWRHRANIKRLQTGTEQQLTTPPEQKFEEARAAADLTLREFTATRESKNDEGDQS